IPGFSSSFVQPDWLHIMDLSLIPEASASCLIELIEEGNYFGEGTGDEKLRRAFIQLRAAIFINLCIMRDCVSPKRNPLVTLTPEHLMGLQKALLKRQSVPRNFSGKSGRNFIGDEDGVRALFGDLGEVEDCRGKTTGDAGEMLVGVGGLAPQSARGYSGAVAAEAQAPQEALLKKKAAVMLQSAWRRRAAQLRFERHLLDLIFPQRPEGPSTPMATLSSLCLVQGLLRRVWRSLRRRGLDFELAYRCADAGYQKKAGTSAADGSSMRVGHFLHFLCQQQGLPPAELSALLRLFKRRDRGNRVAGTAGEVKARIQTCFGV
ncbi:Carrier domain-containing protein, partial [Durusdinium trenchii]